ncbi:hypothetical protein DID88_006780 [Monilinia fructigena]|uniref:Uncharacterized protein n=1 Tax=Monilinia fructigena TaxID=38457 RepID=A0A395IDI2_9HELO|nr:hypothetical protein DID88_006780 [Monilinia fructigena]
MSRQLPDLPRSEISAAGEYANLREHGEEESMWQKQMKQRLTNSHTIRFGNMSRMIYRIQAHPGLLRRAPQLRPSLLEQDIQHTVFAKGKGVNRHNGGPSSERIEKRGEVTPIARTTGINYATTRRPKPPTESSRKPIVYNRPHDFNPTTPSGSPRLRVPLRASLFQRGRSSSANRPRPQPPPPPGDPSDSHHSSPSAGVSPRRPPGPPAGEAPAQKPDNDPRPKRGDIGRDLSNLARLYTDKEKYSSEGDNFEYKFQIFIIEYEGDHDDGTNMDTDEEVEIYFKHDTSSNNGSTDGKEVAMNLFNRSYMYAILGPKVDHEKIAFSTTYANSFYSRYSKKEFQGIVIDTGASKWSTVGYGKYQAYKENVDNIEMDTTRAGVAKVAFGIGKTESIGSIRITLPLGNVEFHVVTAETPFLLSLQDMDRLGVYYNNIKNSLISRTEKYPVLEDSSIQS